jgi:hypothetical protein
MKIQNTLQDSTSSSPTPLPLQITLWWLSFEKFFEISFPIPFSNKKQSEQKKKKKCHTL